MTETPHPWDRLPTETPKSYAAFRVYCALGARCSIGDAIQKTLKSLPSEVATRPVETLVQKGSLGVAQTGPCAEWMARTADEDAQTYLHECFRALTASRRVQIHYERRP